MVALSYDCLEATAQGKLILCHQIGLRTLVLRIVAALPNQKFDTSMHSYCRISNGFTVLITIEIEYKIHNKQYHMCLKSLPWPSQLVVADCHQDNNADNIKW